MTDLPAPGNAFYDDPPRRRGLAPLLVGGLLTAVFMCIESPIGQWVRGFLSEVPEPAEGDGTNLLDRGLSPDELRHAIVGRGKTGIAAAYGVPRTAGNRPSQITRSHDSNFWNSDTWYYPFDSRTRTALAIHFENGIARDVTFFSAPQLI